MSKWISVEDRLPRLTLRTPDVRYSKRVLICTKSKVLIGDLNRWHNEKPEWNDDSGSRVAGVIAWQPLPEPKKRVDCNRA